MKGVMIQGTASDVGKSVICTAICRILARQGKRVTPFKSQNMSNNSYVTIDGKEIGRAQGIQAEAAMVTASVNMNPILLKPRSDQVSEIVRFGVRYQTLSGRDYRTQFYETGLETIQMALAELEKDYQICVIEGAGSPAEVNLNDRELVNMKVAEIANVPVILVADIDRGGVFASIVGTLTLLPKIHRRRVQGIIINKFRGDERLFESGRQWIEEYTGVKVLGVLPHMKNMKIEGEDSLSMKNQFTSVRAKEKDVDIAVIDLPYVSNYTDLEPFRYEDDVHIRFVSTPEALGKPDAIIIPGTKSTMNDLLFLKQSNLSKQIIAYVGDGGTIVGICGGYQMLGEQLIDELGTDTGHVGEVIAGLGIAPLQTYFLDTKKTVQTEGVLTHPVQGISNVIAGYEIHLGTTVHTCDSFLHTKEGQQDGVYIDNGRIIGTYFHNVFHNDEWRNEWLNRIREKKGKARKPVHWSMSEREKVYDELADRVEAALDMTAFYKMIEEWE
ncbi:cobyric acid synthase [Alkalihalobacillus sp. LMS39]|uniref:cobyric acid synthase n=1 Tax=Alkalihalobacillus sp. LMS39 TaxID=2924032 RepID=UPI001FB39B3C|nr:cobyric acid synthase [Alkalihalobacillus sp. LMS39]UOE92403.1 cobyric acid synthase [Alkalihalobacillus sp. LMS39]